MIKKLGFKPIEYYGKNVKELGEGGFGKVYLTDKGYAIKQMKFDIDEIGPVIREIAPLVYFTKSGNVTPLIDIYFDEENVDTVHMVMERADIDLFDYIRKYELTVKDKRELAYKAISLAAFCINHNVMNRDIKPENFLMYGNKMVMSDFGLCRPNNCSYIDDKFTDLMATLQYRAPEIILGDKYNAVSETWAVGVTIVEIMLGQSFFDDVRESSSEQEEVYHLRNIFRLFGTPNEDTWPGLTDLPYWNPKLYKKEKGTWPSHHHQVITRDKKLLDLLNKMLELNPAKRITLFEALEHPYFEEEHKYAKRKGEVEPRKNCLQRLRLRDKYPEPDYSCHLRRDLIDMMVDVAYRMKLQQSIVILTIQLFDKLIDNYPTIDTIKKNDAFVYMMSCTCIAIYLINAKAPYLDEVAKFAGFGDEYMDLFQTMKHTLMLLNFQVIDSTAYDFLHIYKNRYSNIVEDISEYICCLITSTEMVYKYSGFDIAMASLMLACEMYDERFLHEHHANGPICHKIIKYLMEEEKYVISGPNMEQYTGLTIELIGNKLESYINR